MEAFLGTFNVQGLIQTLILIGTLIYSFATANSRLNQLDRKVDKLEGVLVTLARQDERLNSMDQRMLSQGQRLDRVQHTQSIFINKYATRKTEENNEDN